jgi:hypothetical protein
MTRPFLLGGCYRSFSPDLKTNILWNMAATTSTLAKQLALTARGADWLNQFDDSDRPLARDFLAALTLVSHNEFERALTRILVREAAAFSGPIALFAVREMSRTEPYFFQEQDKVDAVGEGSDLGSEARIAAIIRNLTRSEPEKYLNHPTITCMREKRCRGVLIVDDFIGSGKRVSDFFASMWLSPTLRSWCSLHFISMLAIAYSATNVGHRTVEKLPTSPKVRVERDCPTFHEMPWPRAMRQRMLDFLIRYGQRTSRPRTSLGFKSGAAALVFEHGCPNNCPSILWAPKSKKSEWAPLFPERSILPDEASAFPPEIARKDPVLAMIQAGQQRLSASRALFAPGPISPSALMILALAARGIRRRAALAHATGLPTVECGRLLERCIQENLLTPTLRVTTRGAAELQHARRSKTLPDTLPSRGVDDYYPKTLRRPVDG